MSDCHVAYIFIISMQILQLQIMFEGDYLNVFS